jgi:nucleoprotein TPR
MTLPVMEQALTSYTDRFQMLQEQQSLTLRDLDDVTKRNRDLYECFTAVDIECNRVTEDLVAANGKMDLLRNECPDLRAEKRIWEVSISRPGL